MTFRVEGVRQPSHYTAAPRLTRVADNHAIIELGHSGAPVRELQNRLRLLGFPNLLPDGLFGTETRAAVAAFQEREGLEVDGRVGWRTWAALTTRPLASAEPGLELIDGGDPTGLDGLAPPGDGPSPLRPPAAPPSSPPPAAPPTPVVPAQPLQAGTLAPGRADAAFAPDAAARTAQAETILRANGQWPPAAGQVIVLQIEQDAPPAPPEATGGSAAERSRSREARRDAQATVTRYLDAYSGQTAVFRAEPDASGGVRLVELAGPFRSAAHPGQRTTSGFTDVGRPLPGGGFSRRRDGEDDIANLRSGVYEYRARDGRGRLRATFSPTSDSAMTSARDLNHDGVIDAEEDAFARQHGFYGTGMLWHPGGERGPVSVGCQTMRPADFTAFRRAIGDSRVDTFTYVLVRRPHTEAPGGHGI